MSPVAPRKTCRKPGCDVLGVTAYCDEHAKNKKAAIKKHRRDYDLLRGTRTERGYNNRWLRESANFRKDKVCVHCEDKGISRMSQCTDHIVPHEGNEELFWDIKNWQPLCFVCHGIKTASEDGAFGNKK